MPILTAGFMVQYATLETSSMEVFDYMLGNYPGKIFEEQIERKMESGIVRYCIKELRTEEIADFSRNIQGEYILVDEAGKKIIYGLDGELKWLAC